MITTNVIFESGATQPIVCLNAIEAQQVYVEILRAMVEGLPIVAVEDDNTAMALNVPEVAGLALRRAHVGQDRTGAAERAASASADAAACGTSGARHTDCELNRCIAGH
jgi:hypothetical protein